MVARTLSTLASTYGQFSADGRRYTITDPNPPMPWVNVICNGRYGLVISHNGGGFSFYDDAQHNVLTRWEMDLVRDCYGKFIYISDLDTGEVWSATPSPCRAELEHYSCTHAMGTTTFVTKYSGIEVTWTLGVAPDEPVELWHVTVKNTGTKPRRLRICSYMEWCCGAAPDTKREFHRLFFNTKFDAGRKAAIASKVMWDIPNKSEKDHWNLPWPYVAAHSVHFAAMDTQVSIGDKSTFLGRYGTNMKPKAMTGAALQASNFGRFGDAAAALGGDLTLNAGASASGHWVLSIAADEKTLLSQLDAYTDTDRAKLVLHRAEQAWVTRLSRTNVQSSMPDVDVLNNYWLPYQALSGRLWGRTGYYQQSGASGFRDQLQDSQVWLPLDPAGTRNQILLHATRQFVDGSVNHWWHALADFGNRTACSDDYLWIAYVTANYIKETGDYSILDATVPFRDDPKGTQPCTIKEHCRRSMERMWSRRSERGIPHIGSCDWNDGLSAMGVDEKGESVWLSWFSAMILADWSTMYTKLCDNAAAKVCDQRRASLLEAANAHAWDGHWYRYGTKDNGEWIGSSQSAEGKIHLNAQTWSILSDGATAERAQEAWASVKSKLLTPYGPLLLAPAYTVPDPTIGYVTRYSPGSRENGGVYMHAATWAMMTACKMREPETVGKIYRSIAPPIRGRDSEAYHAEPYVMPGNVDGPLSDKPGRAGWTWYTGSAAWMNRVCLEWMLGVRPVWGGLLIDPCPPAELGEVRIKRTWRHREIIVKFNAANYASDRQPKLMVDGKPFAGNVLPETLISSSGNGSGKPIEVEVTWGMEPVVRSGRTESERMTP